MIKISSFFISLFIVLSSCRNSYIDKNYKYSPYENCDCIVRNYGIAAGKINVVKFKQKATCYKTNYINLKDSLDLYKNKLDSLNDVDNFNSSESISEEIRQLQNSIDSIKNQWVKFEMRLKHKEIYLNRKLSETVIKRRIRYYGFGDIGLKKKGKTIDVNDSIVKTTFNKPIK